MMATDNDKMNMRNPTQVTDEVNQRKTEEWNAISGGTNSLDFDSDDRRKAL